jgi:hypothetical protein
MEPFNARLHDVIRERVERLDRDEINLAMMLLASKSPATVVRALDAARDVADSVSEHIVRS